MGEREGDYTDYDKKISTLCAKHNEKIKQNNKIKLYSTVVTDSQSSTDHLQPVSAFECSVINARQLKPVKPANLSQRRYSNAEKDTLSLPRREVLSTNASST